MARKNVIQFSVEVIDKASRKLRRMSGEIAKFAKKAALAGAAVATAFAIATRKAIGAADQIGKTAKVIGVSAEALQELRFAAELAGVSNIGLDDSLRRMQRRMGEFVNSGAGPAQKALELLDLEIRGAAGNFIGTEPAFNKVVAAMENMGSVAQRSAILAQLFGDDFGPKLVPFLDQGSAAIARARQEARDLGLVISNEMIAKSEDANDAFTRLEGVLRTKMITAFAENAAAIESVVTQLINLSIEIFNVIDRIAVFFGLAEASIPRLQEQIATLLDQQIRLTKALGDEAQFTPGYIAAQEQIDILIGRVKELNALSDAARGARGGLLGLGGGGGSFDTANPLQAFVDSFDTAEVQVAKKLEQLRDAFTAGLIPSDAERTRIINEILGFLVEGIDEVEVAVLEKSVDLAEGFRFMEDAAEQAAGNIQDAFAEFFFDPFDKGLNGLLESFINTIRRMIAEMLAFRTLDFLGISKFFDNIGRRAGGGPVQAGRPFLVGERGPELFVPNASGRIASNAALAGQGGGMQFVTNIDARGADPGLIARLPQIMEQRDRRLMVKVKEFIDTGAVTL